MKEKILREAIEANLPLCRQGHVCADTIEKIINYIESKCSFIRLANKGSFSDQIHRIRYKRLKSKFIIKFSHKENSAIKLTFQLFPEDNLVWIAHSTFNRQVLTSLDCIDSLIEECEYKELLKELEK